MHRYSGWCSHSQAGLCLCQIRWRLHWNVARSRNHRARTEAVDWRISLGASKVFSWQSFLIVRSRGLYSHRESHCLVALPLIKKTYIYFPWFHPLIADFRSFCKLGRRLASILDKRPPSTISALCTSYHEIGSGPFSKNCACSRRKNKGRSQSGDSRQWPTCASRSEGPERVLWVHSCFRCAEIASAVKPCQSPLAY